MKLFKRYKLRRQIVRSGLFDEKWYVSQYPEVLQSRYSPLRHYLKIGWKEGKNPSEHFDTNRYLNAYPDVRQSGVNPLVHYLAFGGKEERIPLVVRQPAEVRKAGAARPLVSIIVASYNYAHLIGETLDSLLAQTYDNFEVVVVDDGSTDRSLEVIGRYLDTGKVRLYTHEGGANRGLCATVRLGIDKARGEYVAFCESDDLWLPQHLERKIAIVNAYKDVAIVSNNVELFGDEKAVKENEEYLNVINALLAPGANRIDLTRNRTLNFIPTFSAVMIRKDVLAGLDFHSPTPAWLDFWLYRQILKNHLLFYTDERLTRWRKHNSFNGLAGAKEHVRRDALFLALSDRLLGIRPPARDVRRIRRLRKSAYWDEAYYRAHYADRLEGFEPVEHYYYVGWKEGCNPSARFSNDAYLNRYIDLQDGRRHPLLFHERHGRKEHRRVFPVDEQAETPLSAADVERIGADRRRKVLFVSHELTLTGAPRALLNMIEAAQREADVLPVVVSLASGPMAGELDRLGVELFVLPFMQTQLLFGHKLIERFLSVFDVIVFNTLATVPLVKHMHYNRARKLCWLHEGDTSYRHYGSVWKLSELFAQMDGIYAVGRYACSFADACLPPERKAVSLLYAIPDEAALSKPRIAPAGGKLRIVLAGTLSTRKGQRVLLRALWHVPRSVRRQIDICLVGPAAERRTTKHVKRCRFSCVRYLGEMEHGSLMELYREADLILCPSLDDPMPIVCTEAMMWSKPVVVSDATGTAALVTDGQTGWVVPAGNPRALAQAIGRAVDCRSELPRMGRAARKIYDEHFAMDAFARRVAALLAPESSQQDHFPA